jgi:predicted Fe-Mo cluster-binding NifX family protein
MSFKIALSSTNGTEADLHFGSTEVFYILSVDEQSGVWEIAEQRSAPPQFSAGNPDGSLGNSPGGCHGHSDERLDAVIKLIGDCSYVLTARIGKRPHMFLKRAGITALEVPVDLATAISKLTVYHKRYAGINREHHNG